MFKKNAQLRVSILGVIVTGVISGMMIVVSPDRASICIFIMGMAFAISMMLAVWQINQPELSEPSSLEAEEQ